MTTALLSSLYFMVKANEMEILRKECSRTVLMPLAQYSGKGASLFLFFSFAHIIAPQLRTVQE